MKSEWTTDNRFTLFENGEQYYPRVFRRIAEARHEVLIDTFILYEDKVGRALHDVLVDAGRRGVDVHLTIDDYGSPDLSRGFLASLIEAGVHVHVFDPRPRLLGMRTNIFRRLHRKLVAIDGEIAFVGGINFSADHLQDFGADAKLDHGAEACGPIAMRIRDFMREQIGVPPRRRDWLQQLRARFSPALRPRPAAALSEADGNALFVVRDNHRHRNDIERHYRLAIRFARERVWIANAYFFPGYRLLRELRRAARRGVDVRLVLQGQPDIPFARFCASMLYHHLLRAGVHVHEYRERPMHSKVALVDAAWGTLGSSNLDPFSLSLNLEANLVILDRGFNDALARRLEHLMQNACSEIEMSELSEPKLWLNLRNVIVFHVLRHFPAWVKRLPNHMPRLTRARINEIETREGVSDL